MGMYTEIHINARLVENCPEDIVATLTCMTSGGDEPPKLPPHPLFKSARWAYMLMGDSYYFDMLPGTRMEFDDITSQYFLSIRSNFKNYDNEIALFLEWIDSYLDKKPGDFLGFYRYETHEHPTLVYKQ